MYEVITVSDAEGWKQFLAVPRAIYSHRAPAIRLPDFEIRRLLDADTNPALRGRQRYLLVVRSRGVPLGRCSLVLPPPGGERKAVLGFFECADNVTAARALFNEAEGICAMAGVHMLHGPFSPTTSGPTGIQLDHFDHPSVLYEAWSAPWYATLFKEAGYAVEGRGRTWRSDTLRDDMRSIAARLPERTSRFSIREIGMRDLHSGMLDLAEIFDAAFRDNWSREAMTLDEYFYAARYLLPAWRQGSFAITHDGARPAGALLVFPDINPAFRRRLPQTIALWRARQLARCSRTLVTFAIGIHPDYRQSAAGLLLARHLATVARRCDRMFSTWITEGNTASERLAERFGLAPWRHFAVYRKDL